MIIKQYFAFDLDDCLIRSFANCVNCIELALDELGLPAIPGEEIQRRWGRVLADIFAELIPKYELPTTVSQLLHVYQRMEAANPHPAIDGAVDVVSTLKDMGCNLAIITNRDNGPSARRSLQNAGFELNWFDLIQTAEDYPVCKPDPGVFAPVLSNWGLNGDISQVVFLDDSLGGYYAASRRTSAIDFVAVTTGVKKAEHFLEAGLERSRILPSVKDLFLLI